MNIWFRLLMSLSLATTIGACAGDSGSVAASYDEVVAEPTADDFAWARSVVTSVRVANRLGDLSTLRSLLAGQSATAITALKSTYVDHFGNALEYDIRGYDLFFLGFVGTALDEALDLMHVPQAQADAARIFELLSTTSNLGDPETRGQIYRILSTLGGLERERLSATYSALTGSDLDADLAPLFAANQGASLPATGAENRIAFVVSTTGYHWEEVFAAYEVFRNHGYEVVMYTHEGLPPKPDGLSLLEAPIGSAVGFGMVVGTGPDSAIGSEVVDGFAAVRPVDTLNADDFASIYLPGGHGSFRDMNQNPVLHGKIADFYAQKKPLSAVCHATSTLGGARDANGDSIIKGRKVTGFPAALDQKLLALGLILDEFIPPFDNDAALKNLGADINAFTIGEAILNPHLTRVDQRPGVSTVITGTGPKASDNTAALLVQILQ